MCSLNVPLEALMVFGGCPIPSIGELGCSASVCNQVVLIHQLWAISWKAMSTMGHFLESHVNYGPFPGKPCQLWAISWKAMCMSTMGHFLESHVLGPFPGKPCA